MCEEERAIRRAAIGEESRAELIQRAVGKSQRLMVRTGQSWGTPAELEKSSRGGPPEEREEPLWLGDAEPKTRGWGAEPRAR